MLPAAVLFDMDGTLVDTEHLWLMGEMATMEALGAQWTPEDQIACLGGPLARLTAYMIERSGSMLTDDEVGSILLSTMEELFTTRDLAWQPGSAELLIEAAGLGIPVALVTASWRSLTDAVLRSVQRDLGFMPFALSVAGDEVVNGKPHPEPYLTAASTLGVSIADCLVLEDSPTGVRAGQASGAYVVAVPRMTTIDDAPRTMIVPTLEGLTLERLSDWIR